MTRQQQTAHLVARRLATCGVTTHHENGWELICVNGQPAVELIWPDLSQVKINRHWRGHRPPLEIHYGGYCLRSLNELRIAALLDVHKLCWRYEPKQVPLKNGQSYLPDFLIETYEDLPDILEVKDATKVKALAESLGMPAWGDSTDLAIYETGPVIVDVNLLATDLRKPYWLATEHGQAVGIIPGKTGTNQPYVIFQPDGTAYASRQCPLFRDTSKRDEAHHIEHSFTGWPRPGSGANSAQSVADIIVGFLITEGWVNA